MDDYSNPHAIHNANTPAFASIGDAIGNFGNKQIINNVAAASASGGKRTRKRKHILEEEELVERFVIVVVILEKYAEFVIVNVYVINLCKEEQLLLRKQVPHIVFPEHH